MSSRYIVITVVSVVGLAILFLSFVLPVRDELRWLDTVTGSRKHQTCWTWCGVISPIETKPVIYPSPLANWIVRREGSITYEWRITSDASNTIWGLSFGGAPYDFPPIIFRLYFPVQENFIKSSTDEEVQRFVDIMRHGTGPDRNDTVKAIYEKYSVGLPSGK